MMEPIMADTLPTGRSLSSEVISTSNCSTSGNADAASLQSITALIKFH